MRDLIRRVLPALTWGDFAHGAIAAALLLAVAVMPEHLGDIGHAVVHFVKAFQQ